MKNIFKKLILVLVFGFIILSSNYVFAEDTTTLPVDTPPIINETILPLSTQDQTITNNDTAPVVPEEKPTEHIIIRNGDSIIYDGTSDLPDVGIIKINDDNNVLHDIDTRSVLGVLYSVDQANDNFSISDLSYSSDFDSLYMKCLAPKDSLALCDNWQYVVDNSYPLVGMDKNVLKGNEKIYIYFGPQNKIVLSKDSINTNEELQVTTQKYDYENNLWLTRTGITVGLTQPNPDDLWTPKDDIKLLVDSTTGIAIFSSVPEGEYNVGVKEDYYWPTEKLTVTKFVPPAIVSSEVSSYLPPVVDKTFSTDGAFNFLLQNQKSDGSYSNSMYTDWVAVAVGAGNNLKLKSSIVNYLKSHPINSTVLTDYERHTMALMSLGINPYTGTNVNYIKKIIDGFDGTQFGDNSLSNDDVFALIVLAKAGYTSNDDLIKKDVSFIESKQDSLGSWGSVDLTAASIEALNNFKDLNGVPDSITKAYAYILSNQSNDGGFGNSSSTSWAIQALSLDNSTYNKNINNALKYLTSKQQSDGGVDDVTNSMDSRVWATSYAIPAVLKLSWNNILNNFSKPVVQAPSSPVALIEKVEPVIQESKIIIPKNIEPVIKKTEISNSLVASVALATKSDNNKFLDIVSNFVSRIKAPFVWLWFHLRF